MGYILSLSAAFLSSFFPIFFQKLGNYTTTNTGALSLFLAAFFLSLIPLFFEKKSSFNLNRKTCFWISLVALFAYIGNTTYFDALRDLTPAVASVIQRLELVFIVIFSALFFAEKITFSIVITIFFALLGLFFIQGGELNFSDLKLIPIVKSVISGLTFALMLVCSKKALHYTNVTTINLSRLLVIVIFLLIFTDSGSGLLLLSSEGWFYAFLSAFFGPMGARFLLTTSLKYIPMSTAILLCMIAPVLTTIWQWTFLNRVVTKFEFLGGILIITGIVIMLIYQRKFEKSTVLEIKRLD